MERQYGERIRHLKDKNSQLLAEQENYKLGNRDPHAEQMLSEQLKEMTAVLEEFDLKYTRKEKQLEVARDQNKQLKAAFEQIKDSSGISNIEEIVTTFIKAEDQNYSLYNYVNLLNQETDAIEEHNKQLDEDIVKYQ